jgi:hypothetical protein
MKQCDQGCDVKTGGRDDGLAVRASYSQEWLGKVRLDAVRLMVDIVVIRIVVEECLARVPPDSVPAVVVDSLRRRKGKEHDGLAHGHARCLVRDGRAEGIEDDALERVVVERAKSVGDIETVMDGMNLAVEIGVGVEGPVPPVLPYVHDKAAGGSTARTRT